MPDSTRGRVAMPQSLSRLRRLPDFGRVITAGSRTTNRFVRPADRPTGRPADRQTGRLVTVSSEPVRSDRYDVVIVGAGPAGSAAGLGALRRDPTARVALLDAQSFPRDKSCGDGIAPHCFEELRALGVSGVGRGYPPVDRLRFRTPSGRDVLALPPRASRVIPRTVFDARLVDAAVAAGATLLRGRVRGLTVDRDDSSGPTVVLDVGRSELD